MSDLQVGEFVDITTKGARVERITTEGVGNDVTRTAQVAIYDSSGRPYYTVVPLEWDTVTVERVAPAEWPPQPGDIWAGPKNERWFAAKYIGDPDDPKDFESCNSEGWRVVLMPLEIGPYGDSEKRPDDVLRTRGPLTLVHREGQEAADVGDPRAGEDAAPAYPEPGSKIPDMPGYVVGKCGHRVAASEWRAGYRVCERCPYPDTTSARATAPDSSEPMGGAS